MNNRTTKNELDSLVAEISHEQYGGDLSVHEFVELNEANLNLVQDSSALLKLSCDFFEERIFLTLKSLGDIIQWNYNISK